MILYSEVILLCGHVDNAGSVVFPTHQDSVGTHPSIGHAFMEPNLAPQHDTGAPDLIISASISHAFKEPARHKHQTPMISRQ